MALDPNTDWKNESKGPDTEAKEGGEKVLHPDSMSYKDNEGVHHQIYLPPGTWMTAIEYFKADNFEELGKFPVWGK